MNDDHHTIDQQKTIYCIKAMMKNQNILNGDVFIIPNASYNNKKDSGFKLPSFIMELSKVFYLNSKLNTCNVSFDDTRFIECWFCNKTNDNWRDHGIRGLEKRLKGDNYWRLSTSYVPSWIFEGHQEGDVVTFEMPVKRCDSRRGVSELSTVKLSVTLSQTKYRYRKFGTFEEVLKKV